MKKTAGIMLTMLFLASGLFGQSMRPPVKVAQTTNGVRWVQLAFGPDGVAHIVWEEDLYTGPGHEIMYVSYDGEKASTPLNLKTDAGVIGERPYIACGPKGHIAVVWGQESSVYLRVYEPSQKKWLGVERVKEGYGGDEPCVAVDGEGNVYVLWYSDKDGRVYSRAKVGGSWEETKRLSSLARATQGGIAIGRDGQIWAVWREKEASGEYKLWYSKRRKETTWTTARRVNDAGASSSHPHITVGPDNFCYVVTGDIDEATGNDQEMWVIKIDEKNNPRELALPLYLQHYPRIAVDKNANKHVACQIGGGDFGDGIRYTNDIGGKWRDPVTFGAVWPKLPGIAHDGFGNIGLSWSSMMGEGGYTTIWFTSLYPVSKKLFYPPLNLEASLSFDPQNPNQFTYNFSWAKNPQNKDDEIEGYQVYLKVGNAPYSPLVKADKFSLAASWTTTQFDETCQFAVSTVGLSGLESELAAFNISYPTINPPLNAQAKITMSGLRKNPEVTYNLSWQANPENNEAYVKEYRIYKKEGSGEFTLFAAVDKSTFAVQYNFPGTKRIIWGIVAVSVLGKESSMVTFGY
ncbi:MAG: hypothetical protein ACUVWQ_04655 [Candidatus Aminicenantales bacterium]